LNPATQTSGAPLEANSTNETSEDTKAPLFAHESPGADADEDLEEDTEENKIPLFAHESMGNDAKDDGPEDFKAPLFAHESLADDSKDESEEMKMPLFAHECLGAYDFGEGAEPDNTTVTINSPGRTSKAFPPTEVRFSVPYAPSKPISEKIRLTSRTSPRHLV
jgi:ATP-dependent RNA helicase MRH4